MSSFRGGWSHPAVSVWLLLRNSKDACALFGFKVSIMLAKAPLLDDTRYSVLACDFSIPTGLGLIEGSRCQYLGKAKQRPPSSTWVVIQCPLIWLRSRMDRDTSSRRSQSLESGVLQENDVEFSHSCNQVIRSAQEWVQFKSSITAEISEGWKPMGHC